MTHITQLIQRSLLAAFTLLVLGTTGCVSMMEPRQPLPMTPSEGPAVNPAGREKDMVSLPPYVIEPPDILLINAVKIVPKPPHVVEPFDGLLVRALYVDDRVPIQNAFFVDPEGKIDLGPSYGRVEVANLTIDDAQEAIRRHLAQIYPDAEVSVSLAVSAGAQQIVGEHLVGPDGRVNLGTYGSVYVTGLTLDQAKARIEDKLSQYLVEPEVIVDVFSYNSKKYYIITQGAGFGDNVVTAPITGNDTVLDAIAAIGGLSQLSSTKIFIARPAPAGTGCEQILPVDYEAITRGAVTATNYQLLPGDRLYIEEDKMRKLDGVLSRFTQPAERVFGFVSLGTAMLNRIARFGLGSLN
ncbi:polysaccharide biosynthesis/export family protein [Aeoliella sp. ICT_H6.2]|uniref:Polysaccharide biosynthesis/export family protein n=1 Tax=Aeoliella straminimaris TaxID=2954799 RepID=A0A9X2F799_9BACT|nr:polysaccharide biosynthesis/export family protein [Aeoliella straminimaris]MCO6043134.1 polysaccharide biosynthesis/export family protein [Aeoliella straminimaris]